MRRPIYAAVDRRVPDALTFGREQDLLNCGTIRKLVIIGLMVAMVMCVVAELAMAGTTGIISGVVTDAAKGTKLAGANIVVKGTNLTTVTDANGFYAITNIPPGTYEVTASLVGYGDAARTDVQVVMDATTAINLALEEAVTQEKEAVVTAEKSLVRPDVAPTLYLVTNKQEQISRGDAANLRSVPNLVSTQPGVVIDPVANVPHIRGGREQQVGYMIEGISVVDPNTNGFATGLMTVGLSKMQVYTGGYRAEYGNAIGGVLNEIKKSGREIQGGSLETIGGGQSFMGALAEYGDVSPGGLDYYLGTYLWSTDYERWPTDGVNLPLVRGKMADHVGKFVYPMGQKDKLSLLLAQGGGRADMSDPLVPLAPAEDGNLLHQDYKIYSLAWSHNFNPSSFLTVRPYLLNNTAEQGVIMDVFGDGSMLVGFSTASRTEQRGLQVEYTNQMSEKHLVKAGVNLTASQSYYTDNYVLYFDGAEPAIPYRQRVSDVDTLQLGAFIQDQIKMSDKWQLELGARQDSMKYDKTVFPDTRASVFSPRFGLTFRQSQRNVWRLSTGRFAMFSPTSITGMVYVDASETMNGADKPERSSSIDLGFERQLSDNLLMRITPFNITYQDMLQKTSVLDEFDIPQYSYVNVGKGKTSGCEVYFQKKLSDSWEGWLSYTWMRARAEANMKQDEPGGAMDYVNWDQRHTIAAAVSFADGSLQHNVGVRFGSGLYNRAMGRRLGSNTVVNYGLVRKLPKGVKFVDS
ncbi:MAG: TonB-dependent receptor, partial [Armatimonadota bacterium]|nr:TonB-dependent receptor [Armatimonadota bacterium]